MHKVVAEILRDMDYKIVEQFEIPARDPVYKAIPKFLFDSRVGLAVNKMVNGTGNLWNHQAVALENINMGKNVVISTSTASGKSLIFHSESFHRTLLNSKKRVLVFYPLKALASDQLVSWKAAAKDMNLPETFVEKIDGSGDYHRRDGILKSSNIILMTPDACHAWMMSNLANPIVKDFLKNLDLIVLDEAHTLEGVFGSNFAFLFRRLLAAKNSLITAQEKDQKISVIAATATISNPAEHLNELTGLQFNEVGPEQDGSPHYESICMHVAPPAGQEMAAIKSLQVELLKCSTRGGFITFVDSRKGVEMLATTTNAVLRHELPGTEIFPYRSGYEASDRQKIEESLKNGELRGVISTSALELGIDLPHLQVGINIGVPSSRKSYRQRLGRVGRSGPGVFMIFADENAFVSFGTTFKQYHKMSVEPSYLYLDNRFMQYAHANCLADELDSVGAKDKSILPTRVAWPEGFKEVFAFAKPGGNRPSEFDAIAQLGGDVPQRSYPLRNIGETNYKITIGDTDESLGEVSLSQALRECYPGATYYHLAKPYKVIKWLGTGVQPSIQVHRRKSLQSTKPRVRTWISAGVTAVNLVDRHCRTGSKGMIAECQMQICEQIDGYKEGDEKYISYSNRRATNPNMRSRKRYFRTTGVIICINDEWFSRGENKSFVADKIKNIFVREFSVLPQDIGVSATNIAVLTDEGNKSRSDCIVLFDETYGSLRLTERIYTDIISMVKRMRLAAESVRGAEHERYLSAVKCLEEFTDSLEEEKHIDMKIEKIITNEGDLLRVFSSGSKVGYRENGQLYTDIEIIMPAFMGDALMYQVQCPPRRPGAEPGKKWVNEKYLEPMINDDEWSYALWNPHTQEYEEPDEEGLLDEDDVERVIVPGSIGLDVSKNKKFYINEVCYLQNTLSYKGRYTDEAQTSVTTPVAAINEIAGESKTGMYNYKTVEIKPDEEL